MPTEQPLGERVAALEATQPGVLKRLESIEAKQDKIMEALSQQKGMSRLGALLLNLLVGAAGAIGGAFAARGH